MRKVGLFTVSTLVSISALVGGAGSASAALDTSPDAITSTTTVNGINVVVAIDNQSGQNAVCDIYGELVGDTERKKAFESGGWTVQHNVSYSYGWDVAPGEYNVYWACWNSYGTPKLIWGSDHRRELSFPSEPGRITVSRPTNDTGSLGSLSIFGS
ncbi:hypothetical protein [Rhodococcus sp. ARC_M6]|uniref:hypothetical protein n=1 Tax=Rhodococcus sp. ARC_M6 TaxID=2928852 RepID=UPI001FB51258|nr:hypothetical protein [Rhodococcus sp. ARC_M6]MCJ0906207.1 hypothetical protein [Rhodococcus sp. ARC_M6]